MPQISIIIPIYNTEPYLSDCLDLLLKQTFHDFEAICVDDGSLDNSLEVLNQYTLKDGRIKVVTQKNQGVSVARNTGLSHAKGNYITFLDSDDVVSPFFLENLYNSLQQNPTADFSWCDFKETPTPLDQKYEKMENTFLFCQAPFDHFVNRKKPRIGASSCAKLYKKEILQNIQFPKGLTVGEDLIFLYTLLLKSNAAVYVSEVLYFYRIRENSAMHKPITQKRLDDEIEVTKRLFLLMQENKLNKTTKQVFQKYLANRFFRCVFKIPKKEKNYSSFVQTYLPKLKKLKQEGVFEIRFLSLKNKIKYYTALLKRK